MIYKVTTELPELDKDKYLFLDTETKQFFSGIRLVQLYQEGWDQVIVLDTNSVPLMDIYQHIKKAHIVAHNFQYDASCFIADLGSFATFENWDDTFLAGRLVYHYLKAFSLDAMLEHHYRRDIYASVGDKKKLQKSNWSAPTLKEEQLHYAAIDVYYLPELWYAVEEATEQFSYILDKLTINNLLKMQYNGMPVNQKLIAQAYIETTNALQEVTEKLPDGFNCNSYRQVRAYLESEESDALALATMKAHGKEEAGWVLEQRQLRKRLMFLDKFSTEDGRVRGHFNVATRSGRFNCSEQNIQQIPRALKWVFGFEPDEGKVLIYSDYAQLELRSICALLGERIMEEKFREGTDLHLYAASIIYNKPYDEVTKKERQIAKTANFGLLYGAGANTFRNILIELTGIDLPESEVKAIRNKWRKIYPSIIAWQERNVREYQRGNKTAYTALKRIYTANIYTDLNNIQNQGSGAEVTKLALHYLTKELDPDFKILNVIHDSIIMEAPVEKVEQACKVLGDCMLEGWTEVSKSMSIKDLPMPVEVTAGYNWGTIEDEYIHKYEVCN